MSNIQPVPKPVLQGRDDGAELFGARGSRHRGDRPKKLIFAGISLEVCAAFPAITAVGNGFDAYVAVDA